MRKQSLGLWLSLVLGVLLFAGSAIAAYQEAIPYVFGGRDAESKKQLLAAELPAIPLSLQAQRLTLDDCSQAVSSLIGAQVTDAGAKIVENCRWAAQEILDRSPIFSYAWYVSALTYSIDGVGEEFQHALGQSQATTANQWAMASLRLWLAFQHWDELSAPLRQQLGADIGVLATTGDGRSWLALRYTENALFREDVIASLEKSPANIQRSFVGALSRVGQ